MRRVRDDVRGRPGRRREPDEVILHRLSSMIRHVPKRQVLGNKDQAMQNYTRQYAVKMISNSCFSWVEFGSETVASAAKHSRREETNRISEAIDYNVSEDDIVGHIATPPTPRTATETNKIKASVETGWGGRIRTYECRYQKPVPYRLATPHHRRGGTKSVRRRRQPEKCRVRHHSAGRGRVFGADCRA